MRNLILGITGQSGISGVDVDYLTIGAGAGAGVVGAVLGHLCGRAAANGGIAAVARAGAAQRGSVG